MGSMLRHRRTSRGSRTKRDRRSRESQPALRASCYGPGRRLGAQPVELAALLVLGRAHLPDQRLDTRILAQAGEGWIVLQLPQRERNVESFCHTALQHADARIAVTIE